jgi:hypothetical protein
MTDAVTKLLKPIRSAICSADFVAKRMREALDAGLPAEVASRWADKHGKPPIFIDAPAWASADEVVALLWKHVFEEELREMAEREAGLIVD